MDQLITQRDEGNEVHRHTDGISSPKQTTLTYLKTCLRISLSSTNLISTNIVGSEPLIRSMKKLLLVVNSQLKILRTYQIASEE
jgi:hypothetical protein